MERTPADLTADESTTAVLRAVVAVLSLGEPFLFSLWQSSDLSLSKVRVLRAVARGLGSAGAVAQAVGVPPSSLSRIMDRLEQRGLVVRRADPKDRRRVLVEVTDEGRATLQRLPSVMGSELRTRVDGMTEDERQAFLQGAAALVRGQAPETP